MRCTRGLQANQALQNLQLKGVQLSKTQMERLASSAMVQFLYKEPGPSFPRSSAMDAQSVNAHSSILPLPKPFATRAQPCGKANASPVGNGFGRAVMGGGQGFHNFMLSARRGYLIGRSFQGIANVSGVHGDGCNGSDRESPDSSFFGKTILWICLVSEFTVLCSSYFDAAASIQRNLLLNFSHKKQEPHSPATGRMLGDQFVSFTRALRFIYLH